jgi:hypothetical protein
MYGAHMPMWLFAILFCLAVHRVTRFISRDEFPLVKIPRDRFANRWAVDADSENKKISITGRRTNLLMRSLSYLWDCDWCMSAWVAFVLVMLGNEYSGMKISWFGWTLLGAAASSVTGLIAQREPD